MQHCRYKKKKKMAALHPLVFGLVPHPRDSPTLLCAPVVPSARLIEATSNAGCSQTAAVYVTVNLRPLSSDTHGTCALLCNGDTL